MSSSRERISWLSKLMFLLGLHETMHFWSRKVAKPVVDDTVMGFVVKEERWTERVGMGLSLGALWWWKLRDEVDSLVVVAELKGCSFGVADFVGWWLYYLTLTIGIIRVMKGGIWLGILIIRISLSHNSGSDRAGDHGQV
ncbi:hypothetical protein ACH5RR_019954 [Cinchona calisaya]|uniref:Transmembrane protein n=1 Tax=Cinchona calisaya TaxID=153742 RepID=A0ABD2ZGH0_9GENT